MEIVHRRRRGGIEMGFSIKLIAPCGILCAVCQAHLREKDPCRGCLSYGINKGCYGVKCGLKACSEHKKAEFKYCYECPKFPCDKLKNLEKRYVEKHQMSVIENLIYLQKHGEAAFIDRENIRWTCKHCGTVLCVHKNHCLKCKQAYK
jgi:hypothetical protein